MTRIKAIALLVFASLLFGMFTPTSASAADLLIPNYSFESGTTGWSQTFGTGGYSASSDHAYTGSNSLKVVDNSASANVGVESNYITAVPGTTYIGYARAFIDSGEASIYMRFWDSSHNLVNTTYNYTVATTPVNDWGTLKVKGVAPAGTAYVTLLAFSHTANVGTAYYDDFLITKNITNIGVQMTIESVRGATFGKDGPGHDVVYAVVDGAGSTYAKLVAIDINTIAAGSSFTLSSAEGGWNAVTATDGKIYVGTYTNAGLYIYTPGAGSVVFAGGSFPTGQSFIWDLAKGPDGSVFAATGNGGAKFFKYTPGVGRQQVGTSYTGESIMRSIEYDPANNVTYLGIGANAHLIRYNNNTGTTSEILPAAYVNEQYVYYMDYTGGKLFPLMYPSNEIPVMNITSGGTATVDYTFTDVSSLGVSPVLNGKVYYTKTGGLLYAYDIATHTESNLGVISTTTPRKFGWVQLNDQVTYPGYTLVAIGNKAGKVHLFQYNLQTGLTRSGSVNVSAAPTTIESLVRGADDKIYTSGYLNGGTGQYTTMRSDLNPPTLRGVGQAEGITTLNGKIYYGVYPDARIWEHDPMVPWSSGSNPLLLFDLKSYNQDRPFGMASGGGKLFIGTAPKGGYLNGALTVYDPATSTHTIYDNIASNRSVISLAYHNSGYVYGGTSISGGNGAVPTQTEAKLLKFNPANGTSSLITLPVSGLAAITSVIVGPDNNLWMMAEGYLFIYNPSTGSFVYNSNLFSDVTYNPTAAAVVLRDAALVLHPDGNVYGTIKNAKLFKLNGTTKALTMITSTNGGVGMVLDEFNNLMYFKNTDLWRYAF